MKATKNQIVLKIQKDHNLPIDKLTRLWRKSIAYGFSNFERLDFTNAEDAILSTFQALIYKEFKVRVAL